jgi:hypothetical protein
MGSVLATLVLVSRRTVPQATFAFTKGAVYPVPKPEAADMQRFRVVATGCLSHDPDVADSPANSAAAVICPATTTFTTTSSTPGNKTGVAGPAQASSQRMGWHQLRAMLYAFAWGAAAEFTVLIGLLTFSALPAAVVAVAGMLAGLSTGYIVYHRLHPHANQPDGAADGPQAEAAKF